MELPTEEQKEIDIPREIHVRCPLRKFHLIAAQRCDGCEHFRGLAEALANPALAFESRFRVRCAHPIERELCHVEPTPGA